MYNTLTRKKKEFVPRDGKAVKMFVCGPTVYDNIHIGNARTFVFFDFVAKYLKYRGFDVEYIQNITDIDDRIIDRAKKEGIEPKELARKFEKIFKEDVEKLGISGVKYVRATDHIPEIISQVKRLIDKGFAYKIEDDPDRNPSGSNGASGWYFDIKKFPQYGQLSGRTIEMADDAVSRIDENEKKRNRGDFCLWKLSKDGEPSWPADFGAGRPGWHIEDTAITEKFLGPQYDIHGGGQDLIFPHHEAEIAQQCSVSGLKPEEFVGYWMHTGFLVNKEKKMSKSLGNFMTLHDAFKKYSPEILRFYFLNSNYHSPLSYNEEIISLAKSGLSNLFEVITKVENAKTNTISKKFKNSIHEVRLDSYLTEIYRILDDDFNTHEALALLSGAVSYTFQHIDAIDFDFYNKFWEIMKFFKEVFGIVSIPEVKNSEVEGIHFSTSIVPGVIVIEKDKVNDLVVKREKARQNNDFKEADRIRKEIEKLGYEIDDTLHGPLIKKTENIR